MAAEGEILLYLDHAKLVGPALGLHGHDELLAGVAKRDIQFVGLDLTHVGRGRDPAVPGPRQAGRSRPWPARARRTAGRCCEARHTVRRSRSDPCRQRARSCCTWTTPSWSVPPLACTGTTNCWPVLRSATYSSSVSI